jgi:fluoroacetyl-CoA thioesterase
MANSLKKGDAVTRNFTVTRDKTIGFMGEGARVYATPSLIQDIEQTCRDLIIERVDKGNDSVGFDVSVKHLAPTLLDMDVSITATIEEVEGPKVVFKVSASDPIEKICAGSHVRFVVDVEGIENKLKSKAEKIAV